jgi:outer membrane protein, adhesin transport system
MNTQAATKSFLTVCIGMAALGSASVFAQEDTLKSVAQKAIASNPEVLQKWHAYQAAANEKDAASGGYLPRVDLTAGAGREHRDDPLLKTDYSRRSATLSLTQMLYDGFATRGEVKRLDHARQVRYFELLDASETVALEASRAFLDVLRYRKLVNLAEDNYVRHRAVFDQIQKKAQAGVSRRVDLEQASGRLALAESNLLVETSNLHDVSARYQRLVGAMPAKDMATPTALTKGLPTDSATLFKAAQERNPAVQAAIENLRSADAAQGVRKAAYQPRVDLRLKNERGTDLNGYVGRTDNRTAEVLLSWNLFNGFSDQARARQYADQVNVAKDLRDKVCRDVRQTAAIAYNDTRKLAEQLGYLDQHQLSTEKAREAYRKQFDIGQRTLLDLLDTENELFQAKRAYTNADYDLLIAQVRTQAGFGNLLPTLELSRVAKDELPDPADWRAEGDGAEYCPPEGPMLYVVDKSALNARAAEYVRDSMQASSAAAPAASVAGSGVVNSTGEVAIALKQWADAWSSRNAQGYLDAYAETFAPADGSSREAWAAKRKQVIGNAGSIKLDIADVKVVAKDKDTAVSTFQQTYQSANYQDRVAKTIEWRKSNGKWLIVREVAEAAAK